MLIEKIHLISNTEGLLGAFEKEFYSDGKLDFVLKALQGSIKSEN